MALSFEESKKQLVQQAATPMVMSLSRSVEPIAAYSGESWNKISGYAWFNDYFDDKISYIDENKNITVDESQINISQEINSQFVPFEMFRRYDGIDLIEMAISIHYDRSDGTHGSSKPVNVEYSDEKIRFVWLVDGQATCVVGNLKFEIHADGAIADSAGNSYGYRWKSKYTDKFNIVKSLCDIDCEDAVVVNDGWVQDIVTSVTERVTDKIVDAQISTQVTAAKTAAANAEASAAKSASAAQTAVNNILINGNYATETYVDEKVAGIDVTGQLGDYALKSELPTVPSNVSAFTNDVGYLTEHQDLSEYAKKTDVPSLDGLATETYVQEEIAKVDVSEQLKDYAKSADVYTKSEVDTAISNVEVDLSGYYTKTEVDTKTDALSSSIGTNTSSITSLNKTVEEINQTLAGVDKSPRVTYEATYGDVEMDDGTTAEYMFTLWETEGTNQPTVKSRFQIMGGGGSTSSVVLRIAYIEGYTTPIVVTANDPVIVKYEFSGEDSAGDTNLDGTASWKVGNRVVATQDVATGICEFDLTEYVSVGDNKIVLTITHATGAVATKAWTIKVVDVRLESSFDDTKVNKAGSAVNFTFTPYGGVEKTVHFLLDGEEIATKKSSAAASGLSDSYAIPAQEHGTHLFEIYMTAEINGKAVESNHIIKDVIWYDETSDIPVISCVQQSFTARQYEATNITYTVYDPSTETPSVSLRATCVNKDGETVEEFSSNLVLNANTQVWQYKTDVIGEHILTITCGETVKTLVATIVELGIDIAPITAGLAFDFNPVGHSNNDENRLWSYGDTGIEMTVSDNFDWVNGGYQIDENGDQCFCIKAGTSAEINYELFGDDAKTSGKQFKLIFKTENVSNADATFLSCVSDTIGTDKIGLEMKVHEATIYAKTDSLPLPYAEEEISEFEFNITSSSEIPSMVMGYEDGVSTRPLVYDDTHDFQQYQGYRKTISLGSDECDLYIYRFKVYNTSLSDRDILNNFIADARSAEEMIERYDRNQIYKEGILDPDYLAEVCPQLRIIKLEVPWFTNDKDDKVYNANIQSIVECIYKGGDPVYDNWVAYDIVHSGQGTSSNNYGPAGRNLDLIMKSYKDYGNSPYIILGDGTQVSKVSLTRESIPANYFNVKVNIASSENANNALMQKRYNQYNPYKRPFVREDESIIPYIKDCMEFQNAVIFIKESDPDLTTHREFNDNNWHFYAIGNIGDSKKTDSSRLTDPSDPYECILEVMDNTLPNSTMPTGKVDETGAPVYPIDPTEWVAGNTAYDSLYADKFDESKAADKDNGLADTYGWRYIYEDGTDEENDAAKAYVEQKWKDFYGFIVTSTDEEFKAHLGDYCVLDSVLYYYLFVLRYTLTDNFAKNSFWHYGKSNDLDSEGNQIRKWDLCFDYDNDTCLGIDNYGRMTYRYGYEEIDYVDGTQDWVWNAPNHVFFLRLRKLFDEELCDLYTTLESSGCWSATSLINQWNEWQAQFPEELWRLDILRKYIRTYTESYIGGKAYPEFLTERANGRKKTQRSQFERNQEKYMSSKFGGTVASADDIILRCSVPNTTLVVEPNFDITLTAFSHIYASVKYNTDLRPYKYRLKPNETYTFEYNADLADIIEIYSASCMKDIGDLSACYLTNGTFANATKITELILGNDTEGYNNTNVMTLGLGSNELLNKLDIQNMSGLTHSLDLSGLKNLEELYAYGSGTSGVIFADGGNIRIAEIPDVGTLQMKNLSYLTDDGFEATSYNSLSKLVAEYSELDLIDLINNSPNLRQVRLVGIDWNLEDATLLERLYSIAGVTNTGANLDKSVLAGKVHVPIMKEKALADYNAAWSDLEITYNTLINQYAVTFVNTDGTVLDVQYVDEGEKPVDPTTRDDNPIAIPTLESTVSTDYTFAGWDSDFVAAFENVTIKATYTETTREYTIKYASYGNILQETTALYGSTVLYSGNIPTYTAEETAYRYYLFDGWDQFGYVDGDKTINAVYDSCKYSSGYFDGKDLSTLRPVEVYAMTKLGDAGIGFDVSNYIESKDSLSIVLGQDVSYSNVEEHILVDSEMVFTGSNHFDTQVQLLKEDRDFVLAIDYSISSATPNGSMFAECYSDNGMSGFRLWNNSGIKLGWGTSSMTPSSADSREIIVLRHIKGEKGIHVYASNLSGSAQTYIELSGAHSMCHDGTLVFGCSKADDGSYENHAIGSVYWSKVWYADLGHETCLDLACWPHEKINFEMCGLKRYYLSGNTSKRTTMSFLASDVLSNSTKFSSTTAGGWAESTLNSYANSRVYAAFPMEWRQLIKKAQVKSSIGGKSNDVTSSDCYIAIPSVYELDYTMSSEPYSTEIYPAQTIDYFVPTSTETANSLRVCYDKDGNAVAYWTRSPNASYTSYQYIINTSGDTYGYRYPYESYYVRIMFSV